MFPLREVPIMWFYIEKGKVNEWKCNSSDTAEALSCHPHNFPREINMLFPAPQKLLSHLIYKQYKGRERGKLVVIFGGFS